MRLRTPLDIARETSDKIPAKELKGGKLTTDLWVMAENLLRHLEEESAARTPEHGPTSPVSATARAASETETAASSPARPTTASTQAMGTTAPTSSPSQLGPSSVAEGYHMNLRQTSKTTEPTSSTPATGHSTGRSAPVVKALDIYETAMASFKTGDITESTALNRIYAAMGEMHRAYRSGPPVSPSPSAPSREEEDLISRAEKAMGWLQIPSDAGELIKIIAELKNRDACGFAVAEALEKLTLPSSPEASR